VSRLHFNLAPGHNALKVTGRDGRKRDNELVPSERGGKRGGKEGQFMDDRLCPNKEKGREKGGGMKKYLMHYRRRGIGEPDARLSRFSGQEGEEIESPSAHATVSDSLRYSFMKPADPKKRKSGAHITCLARRGTEGRGSWQGCFYCE